MPRPRRRPHRAATRRRSSSTSASRAAPPARCSPSRRSSTAPTTSGRAARRRRRCRRSSASSSCIRPALRSTTRSTSQGLVNFNDNLGLLGNLAGQDLAQRDQQASRDAYQSFRQLLEQFPQSTYAEDARLRMNYIVNSLAAYEVHVARYYLRRGAYVAAANRAQQAVHGVPALALDRGGARSSSPRATTGSG